MTVGRSPSRASRLGGFGHQAPKVSRGERGAILIHVAVALLVLLALTMFVFDQGMMFAARRQAQNVADAAAIAGAVSLAYDGTPPSPVLSARAVLAANTVMGEVLSDTADPATAEIFYEGTSPGSVPECGGTDSNCVRVNVYRDQTHGNPLPTWFGPLVGVTAQGVRATATARSGPANAATCLRPWAVVDPWAEGGPADSVYNPATGDSYTPPTPAGPPGTGFSSAEGHHGLELTLRFSTLLDGVVRPGLTLSLLLPQPSGGGNNISGCTPVTVTIAEGACETASVVPLEGEDLVMPGCLPNVPAGLAHEAEVNLLWSLDPSATWDSALNTVVSDHPFSPRMVPIAIVDTDHLWGQILTTDCPIRDCIVKVVNIAGFFIEGRCWDLPPEVDPAQCDDPSDIVGRLMNFPGTHVEGAPAAGQAAFGRVVSLIR